MSILVRQATIQDINSPHHLKVRDIFIENGLITEISETISTKADLVIEQPGLQISPGWVDIFVTGTDPGYEFKDTLETTAASASFGGFTHVFLTPNTKPVVQNKTTLEYINGKSVTSPVQFHPLGAITKNIEGKELTEMYEMKNNGAVAFSDGTQTVQSSGLLIKALQYIQAFDGVIIQIPDDKSIGTHGLMNEGIVSTKIGLPGKPALAEETMVARDIALAKYTGSRIHLTGITLASSVEMIRKAKSEGIRISCSCTPYHLIFTDQDLLNGYDTNLKVNPPLRTESDRAALIQGIKDGIIDCITTHHTAQHKDAKVCEFEYAGYGMLGLEFAFGVLNDTGLSMDEIIKCICFNPRKIFSMDTIIDIGKEADLTLYHPDINIKYDADQIQSQSANSPFSGKIMKGAVVATILKNKFKLTGADGKK